MTSESRKIAVSESDWSSFRPHFIKIWKTTGVVSRLEQKSFCNKLELNILFFFQAL